MQIFITIFHSDQEIGVFSIFQNLEFGKASTEVKCHSLVLDFVSINVHAKVYQNIPSKKKSKDQELIQTFYQKFKCSRNAVVSMFDCDKYINVYIEKSIVGYQ